MLTGNDFLDSLNKELKLKGFTTLAMTEYIRTQGYFGYACLRVTKLLAPLSIFIHNGMLCAYVGNNKVLEIHLSDPKSIDKLYELF